MKNLTRLTGIISALLVLVGAIFKTQHWPGAGVLIVIGVALFVLGYAPLLFLDKQKLAATGIQKVSNICVLISMIIIGLGFILKIMHWPGAGIGIVLSYVALIGLIVVLYIRAAGEKDPLKKLNFWNEFIILVFVIAFMLLLWAWV